MEKEEMKEKIFFRIKTCKGTSFVELQNMIGKESVGTFCIDVNKFKNVILWDGMSEMFCQCIIELIGEKKIQAVPIHELVYVMDGSFLKVPIAKRGRNYKTLHWTPVVFNSLIPATFEEIKKATDEMPMTVEEIEKSGKV